jgi:hypothetical protein
MTTEAAYRDHPHGVVRRLMDSAADRAGLGAAWGKESSAFE